MTQHDPLHDFDAQQAAQERGERIELADLSAHERGALELLRRDEPRLLHLFAFDMNYDWLLPYVGGTESSLLALGLIENCAPGYGFMRLTADGARLQAELFAQDGAS